MIATISLLDASLAAIPMYSVTNQRSWDSMISYTRAASCVINMVSYSYLLLPSSPLRPNRPPKPPRSRRKNFPIFFRFSFRFAAALLSLVSPRKLWPKEGAGEAVPDAAIKPPPPTVEEPSVLKPWFPNLSTPSFAAEIIAEPSIDGSKRVGRLELPIVATADVPNVSPRPCDTEPGVPEDDV